MTGASEAGLSRLGTVDEPRIAVVIDTEDPGRLAGFWTRAVGYAISHDGDPYTVLAPPSADRPELVLQRVADPAAGGSRLHLDLLVDDLEAAVERLVGLGARVESEERVFEDHRWRVLADPDGNVFCVVAGGPS